LLENTELYAFNSNVERKGDLFNLLNLISNIAQLGYRTIARRQKPKTSITISVSTFWSREKRLNVFFKFRIPYSVYVSYNLLNLMLRHISHRNIKNNNVPIFRL